MTTLAAAVRRCPVSLVLISVIIGLQVLTMMRPELHANLLPRLGLNWHELGRLQFHRVLTSPLIQPHAGIAGPYGLLGACGLPLLEMRAGSRATVAVFYLGDTLSTVPILAFLRAIDVLGFKDTSVWTSPLDCGASSGFTAVLVFFALTLPGKWRLSALSAMVIGLGLRVALVGHFADFQHSLAGGVAAGLFILWAESGWLETAARTATVPDVAAGSGSHNHAG